MSTLAFNSFSEVGQMTPFPSEVTPLHDNYEELQPYSCGEAVIVGQLKPFSLPCAVVSTTKNDEQEFQPFLFDNADDAYDTVFHADDVLFQMMMDSIVVEYECECSVPAVPMEVFVDVVVDVPIVVKGHLSHMSPERQKIRAKALERWRAKKARKAEMKSLPKVKVARREVALKRPRVGGRFLPKPSLFVSVSQLQKQQ
jgi:hypothetical protein